MGDTALSLDAYLFPDGRRKPARWSGPSSLASVDHNSASDSLGKILEASRLKRLAWGRRKRMYRAFDIGIAAHPGQLLRWGRVGKPDASVEDVRRLWGTLGDRIRRSYDVEYLSVVGLSANGIVHVHFPWFGDRLPVEWLALAWSEIADVIAVPGINVWVEAVGTIDGARRYLGKNLVGYLGSQEGQGRWSQSSGWRGTVAGGVAMTITYKRTKGSEAAREFVRGSWYQPSRSTPLVVSGGALHSRACVGDILREVRRRYSDE